MREIQTIVIHCSDSKWGDAEVIRKWHTDPKPRGKAWADIGYHAVICNGFRKSTKTYIPSSNGLR